MKRCVVWGTGIVGEYLAKDMLNGMYEICAFCDSDVLKQGKKINDTLVLAPEKLKCFCLNEKIDCIILGVRSSTNIKQIKEKIYMEFPETFQIINWVDLQNEYLIHKRNKMKFHYDVQFESQAETWILNFMTEVDFWKHRVVYAEGEYHDDYIRRLNNTDFFGLKSHGDLISRLGNGSIVMDIGCGIVSMYGDQLPDGQKIKLMSVDPLADFYNRINEEYLGKERVNKRCEFGMFEFVANFFDRNYCDAIIINNALDHCIDPYKAIIECIYILKKNGYMYLGHRRAEAVRGVYCGLHKWNIDYDEKNNLIIWNNENAVNVSEKLSVVADIKVEHQDDYSDRKNQFISVIINKKEDFELGTYINIEKERYDLASFIKKLMFWIANNYK